MKKITIILCILSIILLASSCNVVYKPTGMNNRNYPSNYATTKCPTYSTTHPVRRDMVRKYYKNY